MPTPIGIDHVNQILAVTDGLGLHREHVRIPLGAEGAGTVEIDGDILRIVVPEGTPFDDFIESLPGRIDELDLSMIPKASA